MILWWRCSPLYLATSEPVAEKKRSWVQLKNQGHPTDSYPFFVSLCKRSNVPLPPCPSKTAKKLVFVSLYSGMVVWASSMANQNTGLEPNMAQEGWASVTTHPPPSYPARLQHYTYWISSLACQRRRTWHAHPCLELYVFQWQVPIMFDPWWSSGKEREKREKKKESAFPFYSSVCANSGVQLFSNPDFCWERWGWTLSGHLEWAPHHDHTTPGGARWSFYF